MQVENLCQEWDLNPRLHLETRKPLLLRKESNLESGALDRSAILTTDGVILQFKSKHQSLQHTWRCEKKYEKYLLWGFCYLHQGGYVCWQVFHQYFTKTSRQRLGQRVCLNLKCYFRCVNSNIEQRSKNPTWRININNNPVCAGGNFCFISPKYKTHQHKHRLHHPFICSAGSTYLTAVVIPRHHNVFTCCHTINCFLAIRRIQHRLFLSSFNQRAYKQIFGERCNASVGNRAEAHTCPHRHHAMGMKHAG